MSGPTPPAARNPRFDCLHFGLEADLAEWRSVRLLRALRLDFRGTLKGLYWWLIGARLRGAMRLRARIGDRIRWSGLVALDGATAPCDGVGVAILSGTPEAINRAAACSKADILLISTGKDCAWLGEAPARIQAIFEASPDLAILYGDTVVRRFGGILDFPLLASAFDPAYFAALAPIAPALAVRREHFLALGGLATDLPEVEIVDLCLRMAERCGEASVRHTPDFLVEWDAGTAFSPQGIASRPVVEAARQTVAGRAAGAATVDGFGVAHPSRRLPASPPRVTIIIPTRDRVDLLRPCLDGVLHGTDYPDLEVIVVDNGSVEPETRAFFTSLAEDRRVRILHDDGSFNFSRLNNRAAQEATGAVLVMLNNDVSMQGRDWLSHMVVEAIRPEVGAVGAKLLYPSGLIQHGGVVLGLKGLAGHAHQFFPGHHRGFGHRLALTHKVAAVTAACLAVEKHKFVAVCGLDEERFAVALNDVDFCLKLDAAGWRTLFVPAAVLVHHESATRASDRSASQLARWQAEVTAFREKWPDWVVGDPYYNPRFGQHMADFSLPRLATK